MSDIRVYAPVSLDDVAAGISEHRPDYPELIEFIMDIDAGVADEDFTTQLISRLVIEFAENTNNSMLEGVAVQARGPYNPAQEVEVAFITLAKALADKDTNDVLRLLAEVLVIQRKREEAEEDAREEAEANKRACANCNHPDTYHKRHYTPNACIFTCDCEGFTIKDEAPCECGHDWEEHPKENKFSCVHAVFGPDCRCSRFHRARMT